VIHQYHIELATAGLQGNNCIIAAPTGIGKILVACMIICEKLNLHSRKRKVLYLVTKISLAIQQCEKIKHYIKGARVTEESCNSFPLSNLLSTHDTVVCTAGLLKNDLQTKNILLKDISLIVFDECHRCRGQSPYASIMIDYLKIKLSKEEAQLPQIVGLTTATAAGGLDSDFRKTIDHLVMLSAMMDANAGYITVQENFQRKLQYKIVSIPGQRISDDFQTLLLKYIEKLDSDIQKFTGKRASNGFREQGYINHLSNLLRESKMRSDVEKERNIRVIIEHLQHYTKILQYYIDYEFEDSLLATHSKLRSPKKEKATEVEKRLQKMLENFHQEVQQVTRTKNSKLSKIKEMIDENFQGTTDSRRRAIIFVTGVDHAIKMNEWISKQPEWRSHVQAGVITGKGKNGIKGMSLEEKNAVLKDFCEGRLNLLVATPVKALKKANDIPACNLIIQYQHFTHGMKSALGMDSECFAIIGKLTPKEFQETRNEERVTVVIKNHLQPISRWISKLHAIQKEIITREVKLTEEQKIHKFEDFQVLCGTCDSLVCHGQDLRFYKENYVVISEGITKKYTRKEFEEPFVRIGAEIKCIINCAECGHDWGVEKLWPEVGRPLPCLGCKNFGFVTKDGRAIFKKWSKTNFSILNM